MKIILLERVESFILSLAAKDSAKIIRTIELLEEFEHNLGMPHSKHLSDGLLELRIRGAREIRIFYCFHNNQVYLLNAFIKKTQQTSLKELRLARAIKNDLQ